jgi:hypothetical protein
MTPYSGTMLGFNVSDTMQNIRWLMEKHVKSSDMTTSATITVEKERKPHGFMNANTVIKILKLSHDRKRVNEIAKTLDLSPTTVSNVIRKKRSYADRPDDYDAIKVWFKNGHTHGQASKD